MAIRSKKYESEVHIGFLVIVCLLLLFNFVSSYYIFRAQTEYADQATRQVRSKGLAISREFRSTKIGTPDQEQLDRLAAEYGLSDLIITAPISGAKTGALNGKNWLGAAIEQLPRDRLPLLADKLLRGEPNRLFRADGNEYFYVYPVDFGQYYRLIIMVTQRADLALLDDARQIITYLLPGVLVIVMAIYLFLSRKIFKPVRSIIAEAARIGRTVDTGDDEADAVVKEYEAVIEQLLEKEQELLKLNAEVRSRADSLQLFNQHLLASSESGIIIFDTEGKAQSVNESARRILHLDDCSQAATGGDELLSCYPDLAVLIRSAADTNSGFGYLEMTINSSHGDTLDIGLTISLVTDSDGSHVGLSMLMNDLTERNRLRRDLENSSRLMALGEMAAGLAHQLRNSMGAIGGYGSLLRKRSGDDSRMWEMIASLLNEASEAEQLISRFLSFARPLEFTPSDEKLVPFVQEIVRSFTVRPELAHINFESDFRIDPTVHIDATLLKQALANIVDNAVRAYDGAAGTVKIVIDQQADQVSLSVADHGSGIPPENIERIFTPFFSSRPSGSGLGLPLAGRIVDLHSGRISVSSTGSDGTVFTIIIPAAAKESSRRPLPISATSI